LAQIAFAIQTIHRKTMIKEYIKTTFRSLAKNKMISLINIIGLAVSLASFFLIFRYVEKELSYDIGHQDYDRIYRVAELIESENYLENSSSSPCPTGPAILREFPDDVESMVRFFDFQTPIITITLKDQRKFNERYIYFTDSAVFDMLDFEVLQGGKPSSILSGPFTAAISTDLAQKYFGDEDPIGKKITREGFQTDFTITGIFEQQSISHIKAEMLLSMQTLETTSPFLRNQWVWNPAWTYVKLKETASVADLENSKFPQMVQKYYSPRTRDMTSHYLQPISDIHLGSHLEFEMSANSDIKYVYIFISCAVFLILIAIVNFINLSTSFSLLRAKEIGVRKVSGAAKSQLIFQFLSESVIISLVAYVIALALCYLAIPQLEGLIHISRSELFTSSNLILQLSIVILVGLLSGVYPAFFISSFDPLLVFKGKFISNAKGQVLRKGLVVSQFTIAIVLIIFTTVTYQQLQLLHNQDYGYHTDNVLILDAATTGLGQRLDGFKSALMANSSVESITVMSDIIGANNNNHDFRHEGMQPGTWNFYPALIVDEEFPKTMGLEIIAGRDFDKHNQNEDSLSVIINMTMARTLGYSTPEEALGHQLNSLNGNESIIGVVKDFNYKSLHSEIGPFVIDIGQRGPNGGFFFRNVGIKVSNLNSETIAHVKKVWEDFVPNKPFTYKVLGEELRALYKSEQNLGEVLGLFAILTVIIACLGLFALATFIAQQKTKEIGIRKVLGASTFKLFYVGYKEQFYLILGSLLLATPIAFFLVRSWLSDFAYRIDISPMPFVIAGLLAVLISSVTVFSNFYRTITADPAEVLRDE